MRLVVRKGMGGESSDLDMASLKKERDRHLAAIHLADPETRRMVEALYKAQKDLADGWDKSRLRWDVDFCTRSLQRENPTVLHHVTEEKRISDQMKG